jgi:hypothetical protein
MVAAMDELEQKYRALVERIRSYPMSEAARARILAELEAIYHRDRAVKADRGLGSPGWGRAWPWRPSRTVTAPDRRAANPDPL